MADILDKCLDFTLRPDIEGGFSNHPLDKGGPTMMGVTLQTLINASKVAMAYHFAVSFDKDGDGDVDIDDLRKLSRSDVREIAKVLKFYVPAFEQMDPLLAVKTFDLGYNCGPKVGRIMLQTAITACSGVHLTLDGDLGPTTLSTLHLCTPEQVYTNLVQVAKIHYNAIVARDPTQKVFLNGWLRRADTRPTI